MNLLCDCDIFAYGSFAALLYWYWHGGTSGGVTAGGQETSGHAAHITHGDTLLLCYTLLYSAILCLCSCSMFNVHTGAVAWNQMGRQGGILLDNDNGHILLLVFCFVLPNRQLPTLLVHGDILIPCTIVLIIYSIIP